MNMKSFKVLNYDLIFPKGGFYSISFFSKYRKKENIQFKQCACVCIYVCVCVCVCVCVYI